MELSEKRKIVARASDTLSVAVADTAGMVNEACRLRYQVYCVEQGFEPGENGIETDEFDECARHVLVTDCPSGVVLGTVRVISPPSCSSEFSFPMRKACPSGWFRHLPLGSTGEISRFAVSKQRRMSTRTTALVRLGLMQGIVRLAEELNLTHWCAIMEPALLRLLKMNGIYFAPLGPVVEYRGIRQPSHGDIRTVLDRIRCHHWDIWDYITLSGELWYKRAASAG
jgi:N-acyl amino acid synthase of PEP-CTERM/exosortase system